MNSIEIALAIIAVFLGPALLGIGFIMGRMSKASYMPPIVFPTIKTSATDALGAAHVSEEKPDPLAEKLSKKDDVVNHDGVGIVYRPTPEEVERMNEPQQVKEAKAEMEKVFASEVAPEI